MDVRNYNSKFKKFAVDGTDEKLLQLIKANDVQLAAPAPVEIVALYLESMPNDRTGETRTTQWALSFGHVEWLIENLPKVYEDAKRSVAEGWADETP